MTPDALTDATVSFRTTTGNRMLVETSFGLTFEVDERQRKAIHLSPCCMKNYRIARTPNAKPECSQCKREYDRRVYGGIDVEQGDFLPWVEQLLPPLEATLAAVELQRHCVQIMHTFDLIDSWSGRAQIMQSHSGLLFPPV